MPNKNTSVLQENPEKTAEVALKVFFNIMNAWHVEESQQMVLLGQSNLSTYSDWKKGKVSELSDDTLERISYVIGIYKSLKILFHTESQANAWPHKPNEVFDGESALNFMLKDGVTNLSKVKMYLDTQRLSL